MAPAPERVAATLGLMANRGPDASGTWSGRLGESTLTLLHTRLSIIDLDPRANQPFESGEVVIVHNGEIYNYLELRAELEGLGHRFRTTSDTEVIVEAYHRWGEACVERFEGMWAFALLDLRAGRLILSRDRFGEKPLYWMRSGGTLYFGSEVKFLASLSGAAPTVDVSQVRRYLVNGYKALYKQPASFLVGVAELPAASTATLTGADEPVPRRYWQLAYEPRDMTMEEAIAGTRERLYRALEIRLRADVPVAFCLSGGIDSSALASIATKHFGQRIHAFSIIDSDERYDESANIEATVADLGCDHHVTRTSTEGFFERLAELVSYHDAPVATISYYVHAFLSQEIQARGFKVALSGGGADELFTGYYDHYGFWLAEMHGREEFPALLEDWRRSYGAFVQNPLLKDPLAFHRDPDQRGHIYLNRELFAALLNEPFEEQFTETAYCSSLLRNRMLNELHHEAVPVILHEDDLNSMRYSVENRSPYLDRNLAEFLYTVPSEHLIHDGYAKWLLRAVAKGVVNDQVRLDRRKRGFNTSIDSLIDRTDPETRERLLAPSPIFDVVKREALEAFLDRDMTDNSLSKFLFSFVSAKLFLESDLVAGVRPARDAA